MNKQTFKRNVKRGRNTKGDWMNIFNESHFGDGATVIDGIGDLMAYFNLPAKGAYKLSKRLLEEAFEGYFNNAADITITEDGVEFVVAAGILPSCKSFCDVILRFPFTISLMRNIGKALLIEQRKMNKMQCDEIGKL